MFLIRLTITAVRFILALAVHPENPGSVDVNTIGWILVIVGLIAFLADMLLWSSWGPGYRRRTTIVDHPGYRGAYPATRSGYFPRRRVIEEEEAGPPGPGY